MLNSITRDSLFQVPEFSFTNIMGPDAKIYPGTAAVYDLDMIVPAGVDYADLDVCIEL